MYRIATKLKNLFLGALTLVSLPVLSQSFLANLPDVGETTSRRIGGFSNGDLLIGDSSNERLLANVDGAVMLTRLDRCGHVVWSYSYRRSEEYLLFRQAIITDGGEVIAFGSAYRGGTELLFLLRVNGRGRLQDFRLIAPGTVDHFSYTIDYRNGMLMLFGLLFHFNTQKEGFVAVFNDHLHQLWSKRFAPFESEGVGIIAGNGSFIGRSGPFHYAFDSQGELLWGREVDRSEGVLPLAGPLEVDGGTVYQAYHAGQVFFYKLGAVGQLLWTSPRVPGTRDPAAMSRLSDGSVLATYNHDDGGNFRLSHIRLDAAIGSIISHHALHTAYRLHVGKYSQAVSPEGIITVVGHGALTPAYAVGIKHPLLQHDGQWTANNCFEWEPLSVWQRNQAMLTWIAIDTTVENGSMTVVPSEGSTTVSIYPFQLVDDCELIVPYEVLDYDTLLVCGQEWSVELPFGGFVWEDLEHGEPRIFNKSGLYTANNRNCDEPMQAVYKVEKPPCDCKVFLPTAITVNRDGLNDHIQLFSDCEIVEYTLSVYNRWGAKVRSRRVVPRSEQTQDEDLDFGHYVLVVQYNLVDKEGFVQEGQLVQEIKVLP